MSNSSLYSLTNNVSVSANNFTTLYNTSTGNVVTETVPDTNLTTLYSKQNSIYPTNTSYGNANVAAFLNQGTDGPNTVTNINMSGNLVANGNVSGTYILGNGYYLTGISAGNSSNANYANYAGNAFSVNVANVVGIGNIATLNLNGNSSQVLYGNGVFATVGNGNYSVNANFANFAGNVTVSNQPNITSVGTLPNLSVGNITITGNVTGNLIPNANVTYSLGNATNQWKDLYLSGNSIHLGAQTISSNTDGIVTANNVYANNFIGYGANLGTLSVQNPNSANYSNVFIGDSLVYSNVNIANIGHTGGGFFGLAADRFNTYVGGIVWNMETQDGLFISSNASNISANTVYIHAAAPATSGSTWTFDNAGNLTLPGNTFAINYANGTQVTINNVANANFSSYAGNVTVNAQPNITSVGTLTSLSVTGNISSGNANLGNAVRGNYFIGSGNNLSNIQGANVTGVVPYASVANVANNALAVNGANVNGQVANALVASTVYTAAQPAITSVGTLTSLNVSGNVSAGNSYFFGNGYYLTGIGNAANSNYSTYAGTVVTNAQPNITSVGTLVSLSVTGNISSGNANLGNLVIANFFSGSGNLLSNIQGANVTGTIANANYSTYSGTAGVANSVAGANVTGQVNYAAVANSVAGANVSGAVGFATTANSVAGANVSGQVSFAAVANSVAGANVSGAVGLATYATTANSVAGANVSGQVSNALIAGTVYINAQPNITSVGTLTSLNVTGNITSGNANLGNAVIANYHIGSGNNLSNIQGSNVSGAVGLATYATTANSVAGANVSGAVAFATTANSVAGANVSGIVGNSNIASRANTLFINNSSNANGTFNYIANSSLSYIWGTDDGTNMYVISSNAFSGGGNANVANTVRNNAQPNITSVGTLVSLSVTGNISSGNANLGNLTISNYFSGNGYYLTNIVGANVTGNVANANNANYTNYAGTVTGAIQPNITSVGTLTSLNVSGNISSGNANLGNLATANYFSGAGNLLSNIQGSNVSGAVAFATTANSVAGANVSGQVANALIAGTVYTNAQPNITSVGTLTSLAITSNITSGNANLGNTVIGNYFFGSGNNLSNIQGANISGAVGLATFATTANAVAGANVSGQVNFAAIANSVAIANVVGIGNIATVNLTGSTSNVLYGNGVFAPISTGTTPNFANFAGNVTVASQPNITSVGTLTSLSVTGNISSGNANLGNLAIANYFSGDGGSLVNVTARVSNQISLFSQSGSGTIFNLPFVQPNYASTNNPVYVDGTNPITYQPNTGTLSVTKVVATGNITANYFIGNGSSLTGIVSTTANFANFAGNVTVASQPNITSLGTLTSLSITGNISSGNANLGNLTISNYFSGSGNLLSNIQGSNVSGAVGLATYATTANAIAGANVSGQVNFAATANSVAVANVVGIGNIATINLTGSTSNVLYGNGVFAPVSNVAVSANFANYAGNVTVASQPNITSVGTLISLSVTGNISSGNANLGNLATANYFSGAGNLLSNIQGSNVSGTVGLATYATTANSVAGANVSGTVANATYAISAGTANSVAGANVTGQVANALIAGTVYTNAQPNITSVGTLTSLSVTGNISSGNANLGNLTISNYFSGSGNLLSNIQGSNVSGAVAYATTANSVAGANVSGAVGLATYATTANAVAGSNVSGQVSNALIAGTVYTNAQPNITSVGTLTSLSITGNISTGNANLGNLTISNYFSGNGSLLTGIVATATPGGANTQLQYNNNGTTGGISTVTWNGSNISLGAVTSVKITGGSSGQVISTDGTGNLSFVNQSGGGSSATDFTPSLMLGGM
jgi:hypothetical protein